MVIFRHVDTDSRDLLLCQIFWAETRTRLLRRWKSAKLGPREIKTVELVQIRIKKKKSEEKKNHQIYEKIKFLFIYFNFLRDPSLHKKNKNHVYTKKKKKKSLPRIKSQIEGVIPNNYRLLHIRILPVKLCSTLFS